MSPAVCDAPAAREREWRAWAEREFCDVDLGDTRRERRLKEITAAFVAAPQDSIPRASGSWPSAKAAYRFFSNKRVEPEQIYECHRRRVIERCQGESVVLAIGDTTMLDYTAHPSTLGLGPLADTVHHGGAADPVVTLRMPLGLIDQQTIQR
jgi:hypothetical protein